MAIKFSQFVVQTDASTLSHVVGYNGVDNIQITPTNFLNSLLTGTAGQVLFYDTTGVTGDSGFYWDNTNKRLGIGTTSPQRNLTIYESSGNAVLQLANNTSGVGASDGFLAYTDGTNVGLENKENGYLSLATNASEKMRITSAGNVGIGTATPTSKLEVDGDMSVTAGGVILLPDNSFLRFGTSADATIYHDATDTYFKNFTGNLILQNNKDDADIIFQSDDGSGGLTEYFRLDGGNTNMVASKTIIFNDLVKASFGNSEDLKIVHNGTDSVIINERGNLDIQQRKDDADIIFSCDDGSGGTTEYFKVDGGAEQVIFSKEIKLLDDVVLKIGGGGDLRILHSSGGGGAGYIQNYTGDLQIQNRATDKDVLFRADDGSGVVTTYFYLDGGRSDGSNVATRFPDGSIILLGSGTGWNDGSQIYHNGTNSYWNEYVGNIEISCNTTDGDIIFKSDDGSGGLSTYFYLDGGGVLTRFDKRLRMSDAVGLQLGSNGNFEMYHLTGNTTMDNFTGNLTIRNSANDKDISFACDDGSGGNAEYFRVDGGATKVIASKNFAFLDSVKAEFGDSGDLQIYHDGSHSYIEDAGTGDLRIKTDSAIAFLGNANEDMIVAVNNGAVSLYYDNIKKLETTSAGIDVSGQVSVNDYLVHNGDTNTYLGYNGADSFELVVGGTQKLTADTNAVYLRYQGAAKLETKSTGIKITGVSEYANNTAALAGGLVVGDVYRTGDDLKIVH